MKIKYVYFANTKNISESSAAEIHRMPLIRKIAENAHENILVITHYYSFIRDIFLNTKHTIRRMFNRKIVKMDDAIYVLPTIVMFNMKLGYYFKAIRRYTLAQIEKQIESGIKRNDIKIDESPVIIISHPYQQYYYEMFRRYNAIKIYDCYDDYSMYSQKKADKTIINEENGLIDKADIVLAGSENTLKRYGKKDNIYVLNSAIDKDAAIKIVEYNDKNIIDKIQRPIIGYAGTIKNVDDIDLMEYVIKRNAKWSFVFIGEIDKNIKKEFRKVQSHNNVYHLGYVKYRDYFRIIKQYDVAIMPYKVTELTNTFTPYRMYNYISVGIPIVSTPITEAIKYRKFISIAYSKDEFEKQIENNIHIKKDTKRNMYESIIEQDNWDNRAKDIINIINKIGK